MIFTIEIISLIFVIAVIGVVVIKKKNGV